MFAYLTGLVHDRRIDGQTQIFGNAGGLFMNAMTWWDHETGSVWSQPWGRAIQGELKGVELFLLPSQLTTWASWRFEYPNTLALINDVNRVGRRQGFDPDFVIGLILAEKSKAFYYRDVAAEVIVNDVLGQIPVLVWAADNNFHAYVRQVGDQSLIFHDDGGKLVDRETGSTWDITNGLAIDGPLEGNNLQPVPSSSAFDWAWLDFYPETEFFEPASNQPTSFQTQEPGFRFQTPRRAIAMQLAVAPQDPMTRDDDGHGIGGISPADGA